MKSSYGLAHKMYRNACDLWRTVYQQNLKMAGKKIGTKKTHSTKKLYNLRNKFLKNKIKCKESEAIKKHARAKDEVM